MFKRICILIIFIVNFIASMNDNNNLTNTNSVFMFNTALCDHNISSSHNQKHTSDQDILNFVEEALAKLRTKYEQGSLIYLSAGLAFESVASQYDGTNDDNIDISISTTVMQVLHSVGLVENDFSFDIEKIRVYSQKNIKK